MSIAGRLARGSSWLLVARALANLLAFATTLFLARILVPEDFGLVALATTVMAILTAVTDISLASALVHHPDPTADHLNTAWSLNAARAVLIALLLAAAAFPFAAFYHDPRLADVMFALCASLILSGLANPRVAMLQRELIFRQQFVLDVSQKLIAMLVSVAVALLFRSYWALVAGLTAGQLASTLASYVMLPFRPRLGWRHTRELFGFSMWLTFGQVVNTLNWRLDQLLVGAVGGQRSLGFYTVGDGIAALPSREVVTPLTTAIFPALRKVNGRRAELARAYQSAQSMITAMVLPLGVGMALIADPLVRLVMGPRWVPAIFMVQMLASVYATQTLGTLAQALAMAAGETKLLFVRDMQAFAMRVPLIVAGMLIAGVTGIVYARVLAGSISILFNMLIVRRITELPIGRQLGASWRSLVSAAAMVAAVELSPFAPADARPSSLIASILLAAAVGAASYLACHLLLWVAAGRPVGPESRVLRFVATVLHRVPPDLPEPSVA